jgi:hypothetical protein
MKTNNWMKRFAAIAGSALMGLMFATSANADVETVTAFVEFAVPVSIAPVSQLQFGILDSAMALNDLVTVNTDDSFSESASNVIGGTKAAAELTITAAATKTVTIVVGAISPNTGYTLETFLCDYDAAGSDTPCDGVGYTDSGAAGTATLLIGATLRGAGGASVGTFNGSFDVTILYQ